MFVACVESQLENNWHLSGPTDGSLSVFHTAAGFGTGLNKLPIEFNYSSPSSAETCLAKGG